MHAFPQRDKRGDYVKDQLKNYIEEIMAHHDAAGLALAVIDGSGNTLAQDFFGFRDAEKQLPIDEDTIFGIASCTKSFTCLAIWQLAREGKLDVHDLVSDHIPEWKGTHQPNLRIWHLMCHSGGFFPLKRLLAEDIARELGLFEGGKAELAYCDELSEEGRKQVAAQMEEQTMEKGLIGLPGEYFSYCNDGFALLSEIIRRISGKPYAAYVKENIFQPLGMSRSCCDFIAPSLDENASTLYFKKDGVRVGDRNYYRIAHVLNGGGAIKSTLSDLKKYVAMYLNEGKGAKSELLPEDWLRLMLRPMITYLPGVSYASGLMVRSFGDLGVIGHGGSLPGVSSHILFSPESNVGVVVLCNTSGVPVGLIADAALRLYSGLPMLAERKIPEAWPWPEEFKAQAAGTYRSCEGDSFKVTLKEDGTLVTTVEEEEKELIPIGTRIALIPGRFTDAKVKFYTRQGKVFAVLRGSRILPKEE